MAGAVSEYLASTREKCSQVTRVFDDRRDNHRAIGAVSWLTPPKFEWPDRERNVQFKDMERCT